jgi:RNA polymerase sigma factor (sigma-70 family)
LGEANKYTEEELVIQLRQQDSQAFEYLYDNYSPALYGIIYKMVEDKELAEDILQESFVKIWNNFTAYSAEKGRLFTWMLNLTRNLTIDHLRSKGYKKQQKIYSDDKSVNSITDSSDAISRMDALGIRKHLSNLKEDEKRIIDLAYFDGFTQDEISKKLGIPLGTVKTRMRTAIIRLRQVLQHV